MIDLFNKLLARFGFQLVSTKPDTTLVEATVKFMNQNPKQFTGSLDCDDYIGDINYVKEKVNGEFPQVSGKTYYEHQVLGKDRTFFNFDGDTYTPEQLAEKLND
jgi:hypothetical protein